MKIAIATPILYDATSPFNHLFRDMLEGFLSADHEVVRIAAVKNPADTDYQLGLSSDRLSHIPVVRKKSTRSNILTRYLIDTLTALRMARLIRKTGADVLFEDVCYSSYFPVRAAKRKGMRVVCMCQDVFPDNAVSAGLISEASLLTRYFEYFQRRVYRMADKLICISEDMRAFLEEKGVPAEKLQVIFNWGFRDELPDIPFSDNEFVKKYNLSPDVFYAVYAGNIGRMQNVELVVRAAACLTEQTDIQFLIVGDGVRRAAIETLLESERLPNVTLLPLQDAALATSVYSAASVNLIPLVPGGERTALPSKTGVCLSCGRPIIFCCSETSAFAATVREFGAGACVSARDEQALADAILAVRAGSASPDGARALFFAKFRRSEGIVSYVEAVSSAGDACFEFY